MSFRPKNRDPPRDNPCRPICRENTVPVSYSPSSLRPALDTSVLNRDVGVWPFDGPDAGNGPDLMNQIVDSVRSLRGIDQRIRVSIEDIYGRFVSSDKNLEALEIKIQTDLLAMREDYEKELNRRSAEHRSDMRGLNNALREEIRALRNTMAMEIRALEKKL
jgi:hypothetical protein